MKNENQLMIEEEPSIQPENTIKIIYPKGERFFARTITTGAVVLELLYAYFLWMAGKNVAEGIFNESDDLNSTSTTVLNILFQMTMACFVVFNLASDCSSVNIVEDADAALDIRHSPPKRSENIEEALGNILGRFNQIIAALPFLVNASADLITWSYFNRNLAFVLGLGIPSVSIGFPYYYMFLGGSLGRHARATVWQISHGLPFMKNLFNAPARFIESSIQAICNIIYRSVSSDYIMYRLLLQVFSRSENDHLILPIMYTTSAVTAYVVAQSRVMQIFGRSFKSEFTEVTPGLLEQLTFSKLGFAKDVFFALCRGVPLSILIYDLTNFSLPIRIVSSFGAGIVAASHNLYALQQIRKLDEAVALIPKPAETSIIAMTQSNRSEHLFDEIATYYYTPKLEKNMNKINIGARLARGIAFLGFLMDCQKAFAIPMSFRNLSLLALLLGVPTLRGEGLANLAAFREVWPYHLAKLDLAKNKKGIKSKLSLFFTSKKDLPPDELKKVLSEHQQAAKEHVTLLN